MKLTIKPRHPTLVPGENRKLSKWQLAYKLNNTFFSHSNKIQENATLASYEVGQLIAQHGKTFSDGDFIKQCLTKVAGIMSLEKMQDFSKVRMSRNTVVQRIKDLSTNLKHQVSNKANALDFYLIACDESTDAMDTA